MSEKRINELQHSNSVEPPQAQQPKVDENNDQLKEDECTIICSDDDKSIISISSDDSDTEQETTINSNKHEKYMRVLMMSQSIKMEKGCH